MIGNVGCHLFVLFLFWKLGRGMWEGILRSGVDGGC